MRPRLIPLLLLDSRRRLVKTVAFGDRTYVGDPFNVVRLFNEKQVDEICILDIDASMEDRRPDVGFISELASECFMPLAYGGGLTCLQDCEKLNRAGVEKLVIGTAALHEGFLRALASSFGRQAIVGCVDSNAGKAMIRSATKSLEAGPVDHARFLEQEGAGEILLQAVERDGTRIGYDLNLVRSVASSVEVPLIAAGGAGTLHHLIAALAAGASAVASGSAFTFIGALRAVLVTYPDDDAIAAAGGAAR